MIEGGEGWVDECPVTVGIRFGGWFYWPTDTIDEGSVGPFERLEYCVAHLFEAAHTIDEILEPESDRSKAEKTKVMQLLSTRVDSIRHAPKNLIDLTFKSP